MLKLIIAGWLIGIGFAIALLSVILWVLFFISKPASVILKGVLV